ncbi:MAG: serine protease [Candidatus Pacearchaeota archaeon]
MPQIKVLLRGGFEMFDNLISNAYAVSCRVKANKAIGSSTIIYSKNGETYALTNHHVIADNISYKQVWDSVLQKDVKKETKDVVEVMFPRLNGDRILGYSTVLADVVIYDINQDIALLRFRDKNAFPSAKWYPREKLENVPILSKLCCIGAALGLHPVVTYGELNGKQIEIDNYEYWLSTAPSIFGNSGGGVFILENGQWFFFGIPSRISVAVVGFSAQAITHLGYFIPLYRIYNWLDDCCYQFLYDEKISKEECDKQREEKKKRYERMHPPN